MILHGNKLRQIEPPPHCQRPHHVSHGRRLWHSYSSAHRPSAQPAFLLPACLPPCSTPDTLRSRSLATARVPSWPSPSASALSRLVWATCGLFWAGWCRLCASHSLSGLNRSLQKCRTPGVRCRQLPKTRHDTPSAVLISCPVSPSTPHEPLAPCTPLAPHRGGTRRSWRRRPPPLSAPTCARRCRPPRCGWARWPSTGEGLDTSSRSSFGARCFATQVLQPAAATGCCQALEV